MYCKKCGSQIDDKAAICPNCGASTGKNMPAKTYEDPDDLKGGLRTAAKVFIIISMVFGFWMILPLIFGFMGLKELKKKKPSTGKSICVLLFCSLFGGIIMLCINDL